MRTDRSNNSFAVVTTVADSADNVELFVNYHLTIGASFIFVFIDDNNEETYTLFEGNPKVKVFLKNEGLRENWKLISVRDDAIYKKSIDTEVMYRQCLNLGIAATYARSYGIDWLFHLDGDELVYRNGHDLNEFLKSMRAQGVGSCRLINYECISDPVGVEHHFLACRNFKINKFALYGYEEARFSYSREDIKFFHDTPWIQSKFFNFYANGKGVTFLGSDFELLGVHSVVPKNLSFYYGTKQDPLVLHYSCPTFQEFKKKYQRLGNFTEYWFSDYMHLKSKDVLANFGECEARRFYDTFMALDSKKTNALKMRGLATEISEPAKIISSMFQKNSRNFRKRESNSFSNRMIRRSRVLGEEVVPISMAEIAENTFDLLSFPSLGLAKRWVRRNAGKMLFQSYSLIELPSGKVNVLLDQKKCIDLQIPGALERTALQVLENVGNTRDIALSDLELNFSPEFEVYTREQIKSAQYRNAGKLCEKIRAFREDVCVVLTVSSLDPAVIPLLDERKVDYIRPTSSQGRGVDHSKIL